MQRHSFRALGQVAAIGGALLAAACAPTPDLGRYQPDSWSGFKSVMTGEAATSPLAPTVAEIDMRAGAEALREGPRVAPA